MVRFTLKMKVTVGIQADTSTGVMTYTYTYEHTPDRDHLLGSCYIHFNLSELNPTLLLV